MKQSVIDQMKEYKHRNNVKAIKYEEGMEDGWLCIDTNGEPDTFFAAKESAYKFQKSSIHHIEIIPVILNEINPVVLNKKVAKVMKGMNFIFVTIKNIMNLKKCKTAVGYIEKMVMYLLRKIQNTSLKIMNHASIQKWQVSNMTR
jgi:hypothetical protein